MGCNGGEAVWGIQGGGSWMLEGCQCVIEAQKMGIILYWHTCELLGSTRVCRDQGQI